MNQYDAETGETLGDTSSQEELSSKKERTEDGKSWKSHFRTNPSSIEYGSKEAEITDFGILDEDGFNNAIEKGKEFTIKLRIDFHEDVTEPIFAFTIKDLKGTEIAGTNTLFEGQNLPFVTKGESKVISFTQKADLQGGEYLLSFGCTGYTNGEFTVYHRLYDVINLTVVSRQNKVGYYDMNSKIIIE